MQKAIITDLNRCVGCLACSVACKGLNGVPIGQFWNRVLRVGPNPVFEGADYPNVYMYFLPMTCQHCTNPECVSVCPTGASVKMDDGTVQIDKDLCIGCGVCLSACPYGVRYVDPEENVAQKCTLCRDHWDDEENFVPQCVSQCGGNARWFGDIDEGYESFFGAEETDGEWTKEHRNMLEFLEPFTEDQVYALPDSGNGPSFRYILRDHKWYGTEMGMDPSKTSEYGFEGNRGGFDYPMVDAKPEILAAAAKAKELESAPYALHPYALEYKCGTFGGTADENTVTE